MLRAAVSSVPLARERERRARACSLLCKWEAVEVKEEVRLELLGIGRRVFVCASAARRARADASMRRRQRAAARRRRVHRL